MRYPDNSAPDHFSRLFKVVIFFEVIFRRYPFHDEEPQP